MSAPANDWQRAPLSGRLLVEASAGTGKTWTMAALYLRLLLEGDDASDGHGVLTPERIVVATFTEAAAQELGERIRARLVEALQQAQGRDRARLLAALAQMDRAPIGTLHGLCHRLLREHPLECGLGFAAPALGDGRRVHEALARDLLRHIGAGDAPDTALALPPALADFNALVDAVAFVLQPGAMVEAPLDAAALRARCNTATREALALLATRVHYKDARSKVFKAAGELLAFLDGDDGVDPDVAVLCGENGINSWVLAPAAAQLRDASFQASITALAAAFARRHSPERAFWAHWAPRLRGWRERVGAEIGELGFDPLIELASARMRAPGSTLPDAAFARWPVALVDEFQDTDATQYALLDRWYRDADGAPRGLLAMVGDPKQAIYGFRGGDVQAYLRARGDAGATLTLGVNQRSDSRYVAACNTVFAGARAVLSSDPVHPIRVLPVEAAGRADAERLHEDGAPVERPLVIHRHPLPEPNAVARPKALAACADLVVDLLTPGRFTLGTTRRALAPGDIAILLRTNAEIDDLRRALQRRGVPCAGQSRQQVFDSVGARDLLLVLHAMEHPADTGALRAALATSLFGVGLDALAGIEAHGRLDDWRERFIGWRARWRREGVLAVALAVLDAAAPTLAASGEGERLATDVRHLGELLQARESEGHAPGAILDWLRAQRRGDDDDGGLGERSLRLESDARRVRLMTLHASKGLEFPVVLLPTLWGHEERSVSRALAAADASGRRDALFEKVALDALAGERQDERFRLLYVALTRAAQACHLFVLPEDRPAKRGKNAKPKVDPQRSALDALLARWPEAERDAASVEWRTHWPLPADVPYDPSATVDVAHAASSAVQTAGDDPVRVSAHRAPGPFALPARWSFTRLAGGHERRSLEPAAADDERGSDDEPSDITPKALADVDRSDDAHGEHVDGSTINAALSELSDVAGVGFGQALHELLESAAPGHRFVDDREAVQAALARHAVRSSANTPMPVLAARVAAMLDRALAAELMLPGHSAPLCLGALAVPQRRHELDFHFTLGESSLAALRTACAAHGEPTLVPPGPPARLSGSMEGAIDLVFEHKGRVHVLDWKGNALANAAAAAPKALVALMDHHHYRFQALLYTVAAHRLLRQRRGADYRIAEHLGAPVYVFLRAIGLAPGLGVWTQRFPEALIEAVDAALAGDRA